MRYKLQMRDTIRSPKINILPHEEKREILLEETKRVIISLGLLTFLSLFALILILLSIRIYLSGETESRKILLESAGERFETEEVKNLHNQTRILNQKLSLLNEFSSQKAKVAIIFDKIAETLPESMSLTNFSYSKKNSQVILAGFSPTREILFQFKKNLEQDFSNVYFPPDSWIKANDVDFSGVSFQLNE